MHFLVKHLRKFRFPSTLRSISLFILTSRKNMLSQTHETIHEGTKSPLILHWIILSPEKSSLPRSRFQAIAFHFYPHSAKVKLYPPKTPKWEDKKKPHKGWHSYRSTCQVHNLCPLLFFSLQPLGDIWKFLAMPCPVIVTFDFLVTE